MKCWLIRQGAEDVFVELRGRNPVGNPANRSDVVRVRVWPESVGPGDLADRDPGILERGPSILEGNDYQIPLLHLTVEPPQDV